MYSITKLSVQENTQNQIASYSTIHQQKRLFWMQMDMIGLITAPLLTLNLI